MASAGFGAEERGKGEGEGGDSAAAVGFGLGGGLGSADEGACSGETMEVLLLRAVSQYNFYVLCVCDLLSNCTIFSSCYVICCCYGAMPLVAARQHGVLPL